MTQLLTENCKCRDWYHFIYWISWNKITQNLTEESRSYHSNPDESKVNYALINVIFFLLSRVTLSIIVGNIYTVYGFEISIFNNDYWIIIM